jgi:hypothetical protein
MALRIDQCCLSQAVVIIAMLLWTAYIIYIATQPSRM